jgi:hypothetical protein
MCRQHDDAIEKQLVTRQLNIKTNESKNWFTILKKTLIKYDFSNINELVEKPPKKSIWKSLIMKAVECYWDFQHLHHITHRVEIRMYISHENRCQSPI